MKAARPDFRYVFLALLAVAGITLLALGAFLAFGDGASSGLGPDIAPDVRQTQSKQAALQPIVVGNIQAVWANDGGDKVLQEETPFLHASGRVHNSVWDGRAIRVFGARNEIVSLALVLETGERAATGIEVAFMDLRHPQGDVISASISKKRRSSGPGNVELFHVGYLPVRGLSKGLAWGDYDERHVPAGCRRPHDRDGNARGRWQDRPCADRHFPDIAFPLAMKSPFSIAPRQSQTIWVDIYIPRTATAGDYQGAIRVREGGKSVRDIPLTLQVRDFMLPDIPTARTMLAITTEDIAERYLGDAYPDPGSPGYRKLQQIIDRHYQMAHRHRISLVEGYTAPEQMDPYMLPRLDGSLFTPQHGYRGPGEGVGNNVYAVGLYGFWPWKGEGREAMWNNADRWVRWFRKRGLEKSTAFFLYLDDESDDYQQLQQWAAWLRANPGPGRALASMATIDLLDADEHVPSLAVVATIADIGIREKREKVARKIIDDPSRRLYFYNGKRPASGSFALEDDGTALRQLAWAQYKKGADRWFYWNATYYNNTQCSDGKHARRETDVYRQARTFGCLSGRSRETGETGFNYFNGDGVLFYPGTDRVFPQSSPGLAAPIASLRLKHWRRGIQDADYLALANAVAPRATRAIVQRMVPKVLWEYGVASRQDPSWVRTDISWPANPDAWERARRELADIIERARRE